MRSIGPRFDLDREGVGTAEVRCSYCGAMWWSSRVFRDANGNIQCPLHEGEVTRTELNEIIASYDPPPEYVPDDLGGAVEDDTVQGVHLTDWDGIYGS